MNKLIAIALCFIFFQSALIAQNSKLESFMIHYEGFMNMDIRVGDSKDPMMILLNAQLRDTIWIAKDVYCKKKKVFLFEYDNKTNDNTVWGEKPAWAFFKDSTEVNHKKEKRKISSYNQAALTGKTKTILGYACQEVAVKDEKGKITVSFWLAKDIPANIFPAANSCAWLHTQLKGAILEYTSKTEHWIATKISPKLTISDALFDYSTIRMPIPQQTIQTFIK